MRKDEREGFNAHNAIALDPAGSESDHFYTCSRCGQAVDMRNLGDVFHHEAAEHEPIPVN